MKAAVRYQYGPPEMLRIQELEKPVPKDDEVLIKVHATTVNRTDCAVLTARPFVMRFFTGLLKPAVPTPGTDFAGVVEAAGRKVTHFKAGDHVWGFKDDGLASQAEYMTFPENKAIALMPQGLSFAQAAASIEGAHYALNFVNKVKLRPGQKVLVNGATGAIGSAAVQLLKHYDLYVTAVCGTENVELVRSLGADKVIDYKKEDFTQDHEKYDFAFDAVGKSTFGKCRPLLNEGGVYISSELGPYGQNVYLPLVTSLTGGKKVVFPIPSDIRRSMVFIGDLIGKGKFRPVIDRTYPLERIAEAYEYVASGQKIGNVIISMNGEAG